jgi:hypothetical protein
MQEGRADSYLKEKKTRLISVFLNAGIDRIGVDIPFDLIELRDITSEEFDDKIKDAFKNMMESKQYTLIKEKILI